MYKREILTYPINEKQLKIELVYLTDYLIKNNYTKCKIFFGGDWGAKYYKDGEWYWVDVEPSELFNSVYNPNRMFATYLGAEDLYIKIDDMPFEFLFCNDSDIHIKFDDSNVLIEHFFERWKSLDYKPAEWLKQEGAKSIKIR